MPLIQVASLDDGALTPYRQLKRTNDTRREGLFIVEGEKLTRRLLQSRFPVRSILVSDKHLADWAHLADSHLLMVLPDAWVESLVGYNFHRGVLACGQRLANPSLSQLLPSAADSPLTLVICPAVQDPENLGALFRLSAVFGVDFLILGKGCADPLSRRVLRVSMGAALRVPALRAGDIEVLLKALHSQHGVELWATVTDANAEILRDVTRPPRLGLVMGSEGHGLKPQWVALCQRRVTIPMRPGVDSLNVAAAAAVFLYEVAMSSRGK